MRIGISLASANPAPDVRQTVRDLVERTRSANDAGLDSLFVGDHHITASPYLQNVPLMGRLLAEWSSRPAGALFLLPMWDPVLLAEQVGSLAAIAQGRFIIQAGLGRGQREFAAMGINIRHRPSRFEDGLAIVRGLLAGETVTASGRFPIKDARISPIPAEPVEVWIGGSVEPAVDRAARLGDAWLGGPELTFEETKHWIDYYRERRQEYGRPFDTVALRRDVYVGHDADDALAVAGPISERGYRGFDPSALVWGDAESVAQKFAAYGELGVTDIIVRHLTSSQTDVLGSIERLARVRALLA
ncbi:LLM class flavin-dependent oxidoreductase [bacterium]|nr:LLM class flavin-dependent oxidoreductase [bacterium]